MLDKILYSTSIFSISDAGVNFQCMNNERAFLGWRDVQQLSNYVDTDPKQDFYHAVEIDQNIALNIPKSLVTCVIWHLNDYKEKGQKEASQAGD